MRPHLPESKRPAQGVPKLDFRFMVADENQPQPSAPKTRRAAPRPPVTARSRNPRFAPSPKTARVKLSPIIRDAPQPSTTVRTSHSALLSPFELTEILDFKDIYFLGNPSRKVRATARSAIANYGYDQRDHKYRVVIGDHVAYRYEIRASFGAGAFGEVLKVYDHKTKEYVAMKMVVNSELMHRQGQIEVDILSILSSAPESAHIVKIHDHFYFRNHICITFEILGQNLYNYSSSIRFQPITAKQTKSFCKQLLAALSYCHENKIVHADIKPENILLEPDSKLNVKLIDFGSSFYFGKQVYSYIQSRFYRAPEVVLGITYGAPMDVWSFALVIIEMITGRPLFPANDEFELMDMMMEVLGTPPQLLLRSSPRRKEFFDEAGRLRRGKSARKRRVPGTLTLAKATRIADSFLLDLLSKCLEWDQHKRITAPEALSHPWFTTKTLKTSRPSYMLPSIGTARYVSVY